jgi:hypothetical protein
MANEDTSQFEESFMNICSSFVAHAQAAQVVQPSEGALNHPAAFAKPAAVGHTTFRQQRLDAAPPQLVSMRLRIVSAVALHLVRSLSWTAPVAYDGRHRIKER